VKRNIDIAFVADQLRNEIVALRGQIDLLTFERDEARREIAHRVFVSGGLRPAELAHLRGWDCFKEDGK
jgi:predicted O-methyltransferase YrrM